MNPQEQLAHLIRTMAAQLNVMSSEWPKVSAAIIRIESQQREHERRIRASERNIEDLQAKKFTSDPPNSLGDYLSNTGTYRIPKDVLHAELQTWRSIKGFGKAVGVKLVVAVVAGLILAGSAGYLGSCAHMAHASKGVPR